MARVTRVISGVFLPLKRTNARVSVLVLLLAVALISPTFAEDVDQDRVLETMKRSSAYMMDTVSYRGGFVKCYREDLSEQWGEVPARRSMVWVQEPGTITVGRALLEAYQATDDKDFLTYCDRVADALISGQKPSGGWHYFIDFDPDGTPEWYETVGTKAWGWEEFYHFYDNCTFDDNTTVSAAKFLLDLYLETKEAKYETALRKALQFILDAQYPLGGWPQRYPLQTDYHPEPITDYSSYSTFNDNVTAGNIYFLLKAYEELGDERFKESAIRGMRFVALSQSGEPQPGWAQQYDQELEPRGARNYEPTSIAPSTTTANMRHLIRFYGITGDTRFLRGIPAALDWLDRSTLPEDHSDDGRTHAQFVEVGTGNPLYAHREGTSVDAGRYWVDYEPHNFPGHYGMQLWIDMAALRAEMEAAMAMTPEEAKEAYVTSWQAKPVVAPPTAEEVQVVVSALNERGAWIEDMSVADHLDWKYRPRIEFKGISTNTYKRNMNVLTRYISHLREEN